MALIPAYFLFTGVSALLQKTCHNKQESWRLF